MLRQEDRGQCASYFACYIILQFYLQETENLHVSHEVLWLKPKTQQITICCSLYIHICVYPYYQKLVKILTSLTHFINVFKLWFQTSVVAADFLPVLSLVGIHRFQSLCFYHCGSFCFWCRQSVVFVCVWNISGTAERICAKFTQKACFVPRSDKSRSQVKVTKNKNGIFRPLWQPECGLWLVNIFSL